ncbi:Ankyrin-2 [Dactylellina cionopaga]|nr:Ankyrin-2 [Dactylellina cionopaga]
MMKLLIAHDPTLVNLMGYRDAHKTDPRAPIHVASEEDNIEALRLLLDCGADVEAANWWDNRPLHLAAQTQHFTPVLELLVSLGADPRARNKSGFTPVHNAIMWNNTGLLEALLRHGKSWMEDATNDGLTPLHLAAKCGKDKVVELLLKTGANVDVRTLDDCTPLHQTNLKMRTDQSFFYPAVVSCLLSYKADPNAKNIYGETPLHTVVKKDPAGTDTKDHQEVVNLLLSHGADPRVENSKGKSPLDIAAERNLGRGIVGLLEAYHKKILQKEAAERKQKKKSEPNTESIHTKPGPLTNQQVQKEITEGNDWHGSLQSGLFHKNSATAWLQDAQYLHNIIRGEIDEENRVKIAIIDSGILPDHPQMPLVREYKDFITRTDQRVDKTYHGSTGVDVVGEISPDADIYIARVFEGAEAEKDTPDLIAEAINYAVDVWKVDIISLASGLQHPHEGMRKAVRKAAYNGVLVFAAASNQGSLEGISFPARMYTESTVMCMFACSGMGKAKSEFNPVPKRDHDNFALLGENVPVYSHPNEKFRSGTSYATFIGAAVAALILDFTRQQGVRDCIKGIADLTTISGMSSVFKLMAVGGRDGNYDCVVLSKLLSKASPHSTNEEKRELVRGSIEDALGKVDLPW